jgi:hypothetical protein
MCCTRKSKTTKKNGRQKVKSNAPGTCEWCLRNIGGRSRNREKIAAKMDVHLENCPEHLHALESANSPFLCKLCGEEIEENTENPEEDAISQLGICKECLPSMEMEELAFVSV